MLNFPDAPTLNQIFTAVGLSWRWDGTKWVVSGMGTPTPPIITVVNGTTTLSAGLTGTVRIENNTSAPITVTLPASPGTGQELLLKDTAGNAGLYNITIAGGGQLIEGASTLVLGYNYNWVNLMYLNGKWVQV